jgi:tRNA/tmRNA/rRNA uracil-C5-methylase (TrmA/RlmC/RlmD family)
MATVDVEPSGVAAGGDAIARARDGRVVFVEGALPGERVVAEVIEERRDFLKARALGVTVPSPDRVEPPCPHVAAGCGGCQWQHASIPAQARMKRAIVIDALRRLARLADPPVGAEVVRVPSTGYRTTLRLAVDAGGHAVYRQRHSHASVAVDSCLIAHPRLADLVVGGRFPGAEEVLLRVSVATGERVVAVRPRSAGAVVPDDVAVNGRVHEAVAGRHWRVSAGSFFQSGPWAAEALVTAVTEAAGDSLARGGVLVDAYAGVGLLGGAVVAAAAAPNVQVVALESHPAAVRDARANLADLDARVVHVEVARWRAPADPAALVIADPARTGLGRAGVDALVAAQAPVLVLASCDPASLARDVTVLASAGYDLVAVTVLDLFPHTFHVETVSRFERRAH